MWRIDGTVHADPTPEQLLSIVPLRDGALLVPPRSKTDPVGLFFSPHPIHLTFNPADPANAFSRLRNIELQFPLRGSSRKRHALFFSDAALTPLTHYILDKYLALFLRLYLPAGEATVRSFHSFRIGLACCLRAARCPDAVIQALCRWRSPASLAIYACLNPSERAHYISAAMQVSAASVSTANLPDLDTDDMLCSFARSFSAEPHCSDNADCDVDAL